MTVAIILKRTYTEYLHDKRVIKEQKALNEQNINTHLYLYGDNNKLINEDYIYVTNIGSILSNVNIYRKLFKMNTIRTVDRVFKDLIDLLYDLRIVSLILKRDYKVIHCHDYNTLRIGYLVKRFRSSIKLVYDSHELHVFYGQNKSLYHRLKKSIVKINEKRWIKYVDLVIVVNKTCFLLFKKWYRCKNITIVPNTMEKYIKQDTPSLKQIFNIPNEMKLVIYEGTLVQDKGLDLILEASKQLKDYAYFILAGSCRSAIEWNIYPNVRYLGLLESKLLYEYISQCDVGICLIKNINMSYYYSSPNKLWDYILCGIPCIGSNLPNIAHVISKYNVGKVVEYGNTRQLVDCIKEVTSPKLELLYKENIESLSLIVDWKRTKINFLKTYFSCLFKEK